MNLHQRWAAGVEYLGTNFCGWQSQAGLPAIQSEVESALSSVANHAVAISAAGRTDAGVHAFQQVIHFDSAASRTPYAWLLGSNSQMGPDVALRWIRAATLDFHARHSAIARSYRYVIHCGASRSALTCGRAAWHPPRVDGCPSPSASAHNRAGCR